MKRIVYGVMFILLVTGTLTLASNIQSEYGRGTSDNEQSEVTLASVMSGGGSAEVRFDPATYTFIAERGIGVGYRFNTTIELYDVTELFAWQIRVYFNNTLLNATNAYYHPDEPLHTVGGFPVSPVIVNDYNATHGYVQHGISALYPNYVNVTAENYPLGIGICILEFEVLMKPSAGKTLESNLTLNNPDTRLRKDPSTIIQCTKKNGLCRLINANIKVPTDYSTIQAAINAADPGNTIFVYNGTYYENVAINKTVVLVGQSALDTVINGTGNTVVYIGTADNVMLDGFTIVSGGHGIHIYNSKCNTISNNIITRNAGSGLHIDAYRERCSDLVLLNNNITASGDDGIYLRVFGNYNAGADGNSWIIKGNEIIGNDGNGVYIQVPYSYSSASNWVIDESNIKNNSEHGIYVDTGEYVGSGGQINGWIIYQCNIFDNGQDGIHALARAYGGFSESNIDNWFIQLNNISYNGVGIYSKGSSAHHPNYGYTYGYCNGWLLSRNNLTNNECGIQILQFSDGWTLRRNLLISNEYGIRISFSSHVLRDNEMDNNSYNFGVTGYYIQDVDVSNKVNEKPIYYIVDQHGGQVPSDAGYVALIDSTNVTISNLSLSHNEQGMMLIRTENITLEYIHVGSNIYGIFLKDSSNFTAFNTQAINNTYGVYVQNSTNCSVYNNNAKNNTHGIHLEDSANCTITGTSVEENEYGIYLSGSSNNTFYHNNFEQNNQQVAIEGTVVNVWNSSYPSGGNYWSDHTGPDWCKGIYQNETGSDGIVDANMTIDQNNIDYYPLSAPWSSPINIIMPGNTMHRGTNITLTFTLEFDASWIGYSLDGQANVTTTGNTTLTDLSYGWHDIIVYANDTYGNMWSSIKVRFAITFLTDTNYDQTVDIDDLVETTWRYGAIPGDPRWNIYADVNRDGIIDIEDVAMVADDYGKTWY